MKTTCENWIVENSGEEHRETERELRIENFIMNFVWNILIILKTSTSIAVYHNEI